MSRRIAFVFPGQGAQKVGMGLELSNTYPEAQAVFNTFDSVMDQRDNPCLSNIVFNGPAETLTQTQFTQPGILATSLAALAVFQTNNPNIRPVVTAGHSLGEYGALVAANVLTVEQASLLVVERACLMSQASAGAMSAVLGLNAVSVETVLASYRLANPNAVVAIANDNSPEQQVITGQPEAVAAVEPLLKEAGAKRVIPLTVGGAFHSPLMTPAAQSFQGFLADKPFANATVPVITNVSASQAPQGQRDADTFRAQLSQQIDHSVQWTATMQAMIETHQVDTIIEFGPGTVLSGLFKKFNRSLTCLNVSDTATLETTMSALQAEPALV
ncbi:MAG: ACP S-malonyltransferase [Vampirovibrionales bacterium]|nr:ACP S-malonyltransferase [Vampirovibrionales bacterium]